MGIRFKITLGFAVLTIFVVSVVSFWAAQSLGFTLDQSDFEKLQDLQTNVIQQLDYQQLELDRLTAQASEAIAAVSFFSLNRLEQQRFAEKLKNSLTVEWLELFREKTPLLFSHASFEIPEVTAGKLLRLSKTGPFSYQGYLVSAAKLPGSDSETIFSARKPEFTNSAIPLVCLFDKGGILFSSASELNLEKLLNLARGNITEQIQLKRETYRVRVFKIEQRGMSVLVGYPAQRASLTRASVDELMLRLALLEVIGLLILGYFLGRKLLSPLNALQNGIERVAAGHWREIPLDEPPMKGSGDEIETVAKSFNHMVRELSSAQMHLIEVQKELAKKDKMAALGRFSAGIAHEINNPLGTILVTAGMLKEAAARNTRINSEEFDEIIEEVKRCRDIIASLRTYTGRTHSALTRTSFAAFFSHMKEQILANPEFKGLDLLFTDSPEIEKKEIKVDQKAMLQVFGNLLKNASDAVSEVPDKQIKITAELAENHAFISFQDNGKGFECQPEHIFEPLFTTKPQGTGLGLVICQAIIDGHHGRITAKRINDSTTEFVIELPLVQEVSPEDSEIFPEIENPEQK